MKIVSSTALVAAASLALTADAAARYKACTESERQSIFGGLTNELKTCATSTTFDLTGKSLPTSDERQAVCKCTDLVKRLGDLYLPRCNLVLDGSSLSFKEAVTSIFTECGIAEPKEVPETLAPGANSTSATASDTVASEALPPTAKANATTKPSAKTSSSGSGLSIEPLKTPKPTKKPTPTPMTASPESSSSGADSNSTPAPTKSGSPVHAMTSATVAAVVAIAAYTML